jgi:hypothetical protein
MNVRVQRLFRARSSLVLLAKRYTSTEVPPPQPRRGSESYARPFSEFQGKTPSLLKSEAPKTGDASVQWNEPQRASSLHPSLQEGYKDGGQIKPGRVLKVHDQDGVPMWGDGGIPVSFVSRSSPHTTIL